MGQWRVVRKMKGSTVVEWQREGFEVGWLGGRTRDEWILDEFTGFLTGGTTSNYMLPRVTAALPQFDLYVPWLWVVAGWGVVTWVV